MIPEPGYFCTIMDDIDIWFMYNRMGLGRQKWSGIGWRKSHNVRYIPMFGRRNSYRWHIDAARGVVNITSTQLKL